MTQNIKSNLFTPEQMAQQTECHLPRGLSLRGEIHLPDGLSIIDATLENCQIKAPADSIVVFSELAEVKGESHFMGHNALLLGKFHGTITAQGDVEFGPTAHCVGECQYGGASTVSRIADLDQMPLVRLKNNNRANNTTTQGTPFGNE